MQLVRLFAAVMLPAWIASSAGAQGVLYRLTEPTTGRAEYCLGPCACALGAQFGPVRGTFVLTFDHADPLFDHYRVDAANWTFALPSGTTIALAGGGSYRVGGEVALTQSMSLTLDIDDRTTQPFESDTPAVTVPWPNIAIRVSSPVFGCELVAVTLVAEPHPCPADLDENGHVGLRDLATLLSHFGSGGASHADGDINGDSLVDLSDLAALLRDYGTPCPT